MHTTKVSFESAETVDFEILNSSVSFLLGAWRMNGQILGKQFLIAQKSNGFEVFVNTSETNSLAEQFNNKYVNQSLAKLSELKVFPNITVLGEEPESANLCECKRLKSYILFTKYLSLESPLRCFNCFGVVPLYKIPKTYDDEYYNIICWESDYQSCDSLQMNCKVGERFGLNQLSKLDSQLTRQGLEVCQTIEKVTGKKVYYYLYKYGAKSYKSELARKCPNCQSYWYLKEPLHNLFDFKCKSCKLLSNIAFDVR